MAKFSGSSRAPVPERLGGGVRTIESADTAEGGQGFKRDAESDLFLLAATNMVGEDTFYETASKRDERFRDLIHQVTATNPEFVARMVPWVRDTMNMRSASAVMAAEYCRGLHLAGNAVRKNAPPVAQVVDSACSRPDEPAEIMAYWLATYGRPLPISLRRGLERAVQRLYHEKAVLKYDGQSRSTRMGDVVDMIHPTPRDDKQAALFNFILTRRHHPDGVKIPSELEIIERASILDRMDEAEFRATLLGEGPQALADAGYTWERVSGKTALDASAWDALIPTMGYMALLRNLRNFDQAGISKTSIDFVKEKLADPGEVARSRQFPYRFLSAYENVQGLHWSEPLEAALNLSCSNMPDFPGRTLVLVDVSGSMFTPVSRRSSMERWKVGAVFGAAMAIKNAASTNLVAFGTDSKEIKFGPNSSVLRLIDEVRRANVGHSTNIWQSVERHWDRHNRVVIFSDMQCHDYASALVSQIDFIHGFNLAGYGVTTIESARRGRFEYAGFNDSMLQVMLAMETFGITGWPF